jgi:hypothetical protein
MGLINFISNKIPEEKFEITTSISEDEIIQKLSSIIETNKSIEYYIFKAPKKLFVGYFTQNYFHAFTPMQYMRRYKPLVIEIKGKINKIDNNTFKINFSINADSIIQLYYIICILFLIITIILKILDESAYGITCFGVIISIFIYIIKYFMYYEKVKNTKELILKLFNSN